MTQFFRKIFKATIESTPTIAEEISRAEECFSGCELIAEILKIEGLENKDLWLQDDAFRERWYFRYTELCAKYMVDCEISCGGLS